MTTVTSGAVLNAALQNNIASLQKTQFQISQTQLRLATGLKVNSAIDNPSSFFQARSLNARAASLESLLDGIGQSISTIQQASTSIGSIQSLADQAQAIVDEALLSVASGTIEARINGDRDFSSVTDLTSISGVDNLDRLLFSFIEPDDTVNSGNVVTITAGDSPSVLIDSINSILDSNLDSVFDAELDSFGGLQIRALNGNRFEIEFQDSGSNADSVLASALGFGDLTIDELEDDIDRTRITISAEPSLTSVILFDQSTNLTATASTLLEDLTITATGPVNDIFDADNAADEDYINVSVNGGTAVTVTTVFNKALQDLIDGINGSSILNSSIEATFSDGVLNIRAIDGDVRSIQFEIIDNNSGNPEPKLDLQKLGFGTQVLLPSGVGVDISSESIQLGSAAGTLAQLEGEYNTIRTQIDLIVSDSSFSGINLLSGDSLTTYFNESRTSSLTTTGQSFTSSALGVSEGNFGRNNTINDSVSDLSSANDTITNFSFSLSNDLSIIQSRETFTNDTINTLQEGANKLIVADENEEGAKLLALQTRQLLGVSALSLGVLSQQSTLRLF